MPVRAPLSAALAAVVAVGTGVGAGGAPRLRADGRPRPSSGALARPGGLRPCGYLRGRPRVDQVLVIWEENHSYSSVIGSPAAPEINRLAARCGLATGYVALDHPSLPNYLQMTSGALYSHSPWTSDCGPSGACTTRVASVFSELDQAHKQWRSYAESMATNCDLVTAGTYAARHNPAVYYTSVRRRCQQWDQPLGTLSEGPLSSALAHGPRAALTTVSPNVEDDMHDGTVKQADTWLAGWVPRIVASPAYRSGHLAVLIVWDEGFGSGDQQSSAPLVVMSASTPAGTRSGLAFNDFSVLRTVSQLSGVRPLGSAARAPSLVRPFRL